MWKSETSDFQSALAAAVWERALAWAQVLAPDWAMDSQRLGRFRIRLVTH